MLDINTSTKSRAVEKEINENKIISDESPYSTSITVSEEKHDISKEETNNNNNNERIDKLIEEVSKIKLKDKDRDNEIKNLKKENKEIKKVNEKIKNDINYLKKITNSLGIKIFVEKFLKETGLNLNINVNTTKL